MTSVRHNHTFVIIILKNNHESTGPLRRGSRGYLCYRARNFYGAQNFENAARKKFCKKFERANLDWLKADKVTHRHHLPVIPLSHS